MIAPRYTESDRAISTWAIRGPGEFLPAGDGPLEIAALGRFRFWTDKAAKCPAFSQTQFASGPTALGPGREVHRIVAFSKKDDA